MKLCSPISYSFSGVPFSRRNYTNRTLRVVVDDDDDDDDDDDVDCTRSKSTLGPIRRRRRCHRRRRRCSCRCCRFCRRWLCLLVGKYIPSQSVLLVGVAFQINK